MVFTLYNNIGDTFVIKLDNSILLKFEQLYTLYSSLVEIISFLDINFSTNNVTSYKTRYPFLFYSHMLLLEMEVSFTGLDEVNNVNKLIR